MSPSIYLGSICLEPNRWSPSKRPSYSVGDWLERIAAAGFDGIELWENHFLLADAAEQATLAAATPLAIYNSYALPDNAAAMEASARGVELLGARAVKFNVGKDTARLDEELAIVSDWARQMPGAKLLCECHPGTTLETPQAAQRAFDVWDAARFGVMIHPFTTPLAELRDWLRLLGPKVEHAHCQIRGEDGRPVRLDQRQGEARRALDVLREGGFAGSFTIEFTLGTSTPDDLTEILWENALRDLEFLREVVGS